MLDSKDVQPKECKIDLELINTDSTKNELAITNVHQIDNNYTSDVRIDVKDSPPTALHNFSGTFNLKYFGVSRIHNS